MLLLPTIFTARNEVAGGAWLQGRACVVAGGHAWLVGGHAWLVGGHAWLQGGGMCGCQGACVVAGGCVVCRGGMCGCGGMWLQGVCMVAGGACVGYNEIWSMSGWYASYWNAFLFSMCNYFSSKVCLEAAVFKLHYYHPQTKFAKVKFLQVCGCPGGGCVWLLRGGGHAWLLQGGMHGCSGGGCAWLLQEGHVWLLPGGACMVAPGCVRGCSRGRAWLLQGGHAWLLLGGACVVAPGQRHASDTTTYGYTINERAVRILLECIFVK